MSVCLWFYNNKLKKLLSALFFCPNITLKTLLVLNFALPLSLNCFVIWLDPADNENHSTRNGSWCPLGFRNQKQSGLSSKRQTGKRRHLDCTEPNLGTGHCTRLRGADRRVELCVFLPVWPEQHSVVNYSQVTPLSSSSLCLGYQHHPTLRTLIRSQGMTRELDFQDISVHFRTSWDFPGGPVAKTPCSQRSGPRVLSLVRGLDPARHN